MARTISSLLDRERSEAIVRRALWPAALIFGIAAIVIGQLELAALDALAGFALVGLGLAARSLRPRSRVGIMMAAAGFAWFLGALVSWAIYLHRGPIAHLLLTYPGGRLMPTSPVDRAGIVAAYAYAGVYPVAGNEYATTAFALGLVALTARRYLVVGGPEHRACLSALVAATAFSLVLVVGSAARLSELDADRPTLWAYDAVVCLVAVGLFVDLLWGRWAQATVTGLVVELGEPGAVGSLRDRLARTLGDPTLVVGYRLPERDRYVDEAGRPIELPSPDAQHAVTPIHEDGRQVAVLVHDTALLEDPALMSAAAAATRLAVSNARLQANVREQVAEVDASRRRIVAAADEQRRRLGEDLAAGTSRPLGRVAELAARIDPDLERQVVGAQLELRALARGIHPSVLTERGLAEALRELSDRAGATVEFGLGDQRLDPATEAAAYFVCAEALTNVAKHADASRAIVRARTAKGLLTVEVTDDGVGGADTAAGSGLQGLADRVEALGGRLTVTSPPAGGTSVVAELPCR